MYPRRVGSESPGQPSTNIDLFEVHISSKNAMKCLIPYYNTAAVTLMFQDGYVNCHGVRSVFQEDVWDESPCILNEVIITTQELLRRSKEKNVYGNAICVVILEGTKSNPRAGLTCFTHTQGARAQSQGSQRNLCGHIRKPKKRDSY
jgi:hypothetical protein